MSQRACRRRIAKKEGTTFGTCEGSPRGWKTGWLGESGQVRSGQGSEKGGDGRWKGEVRLCIYAFLAVAASQHIKPEGRRPHPTETDKEVAPSTFRLHNAMAQDAADELSNRQRRGPRVQQRGTPRVIIACNRNRRR